MSEFPVGAVVFALIVFPTALGMLLMRRAAARRTKDLLEAIAEQSGAPIAGLPERSPLGRLSNGRRPLSITMSEMLILVVALGGLAGLFVLAGVSRHADAERSIPRVAAALEAEGYGGTQVQPSSNTLCPRETFGYRWRAMGARGYACLQRGGDVRIVVGQRWRDGRTPQAATSRAP